MNLNPHPRNVVYVSVTPDSNTKNSYNTDLALNIYFNIKTIHVIMKIVKVPHYALMLHTYNKLNKT